MKRLRQWKSSLVSLILLPFLRRNSHCSSPRLLNQWGVLEKRNTLWFSHSSRIDLCDPSVQGASSFCLPSLSAQKWDLLGTYLGLTWDLLGTHIPLRADGFVSVTLSWITSQRYGFSGTWQTFVPSLVQVLSRMLCFGRLSNPFFMLSNPFFIYPLRICYRCQVWGIVHL